MLRRIHRLTLLSVSLVVLVACQTAPDPTPPNRTPDPFSFADVTGAEPGELVTSDAITVAGVDVAVTLEVSGGDSVALVNGDEIASGSTVVAGDEVQVRITASDLFSTTVTATVTIGGVSADFSVTTRDSDPAVTPDTFSFEPVSEAELTTEYFSDTVTVAGIDVAVPASVGGDDSAVLIVNGLDAAGDVDVEAGDELQVRLTSSDDYETAVTATVTIGSVSADFVVTTKASPSAPEISLFASNPASVMWGDENVELSWTVMGDVTSLVLTNDYDDTEVDVMGLAGTIVTVPSDTPAISYVLTAANDELGVSVSDDITIDIELWVCVNPSDTVAIADPALEEALRVAFAAIQPEEPITCGDMQGLIEFSAGNFLDAGDPSGHVLGDIESLAGLQHAVTLEVLDLQVNLVRDITPLANLPALEVLVLDLNPVEDLSPLANLTQLTQLSLWFLQERDETAFPYATDEYEPALCGQSGMADFAPLSGLVNLTELYLSFNAATTMSFVENMTELQTVFMMCNAIESLSSLAGLTDLEVLWAQSNAIGDTGIASLATLSSLQWVRLDYNRISDLSPMADLERLYSVEVEGNFLESVAALAGNVAFPEEPGPAGAPALPTLSVGFNCFDTTPGSDADLEVEAIEARGVDVISFEEVFQRPADECAIFEPSFVGPLLIEPQARPFGQMHR